MDENNQLEQDFVQLARLSISEQWDDVRLLIARLLRRYRSTRPGLAEQLNEFLKVNPTRRGGPLREAPKFYGGGEPQSLEADSKLTPLKSFEDANIVVPFLAIETRAAINQLILERKKSSALKRAGLSPARSAIFQGPPGVGKTLTARWIAQELGKPLLVLDLTAVMSSYLGRTGINLRSAIEYAKTTDAVLLLDEIDSIAKRRSDDADIGELKRLVTVVLQEVDAWPETSLLLAATNHPELIDPALWRRFDITVNFDLPAESEIRESIVRFLGSGEKELGFWVDTLVQTMKGMSFSQVEKAIQRFRRSIALQTASADELVENWIQERSVGLSRDNRIQLALILSKETKLSQHRISDMTGVARDTIRKYSEADKGD
jgi:MoxR-like ATPase